MAREKAKDSKALSLVEDFVYFLFNFIFSHVSIMNFWTQWPLLKRMVASGGCGSTNIDGTGIRERRKMDE